MALRRWSYAYCLAHPKLARKSLSGASADLSMQRSLAPKLAHPGKNAAPLVAFNAAALGGVAYRAIVRSKRRSTHHSNIVAVWLHRQIS